MILLVDAGAVARLRFVTADKGRYYYCAAAPMLAIVRVDGSDLVGLLGQTVDAQVGWDGGTAGFVREANEGRRHTKITIRRVLRGARAASTLSAMLADAPRE